MSLAFLEAGCVALVGGAAGAALIGGGAAIALGAATDPPSPALFTAAVLAIFGFYLGAYLILKFAARR